MEGKVVQIFHCFTLTDFFDKQSNKALASELGQTVDSWREYLAINIKRLHFLKKLFLINKDSRKDLKAIELELSVITSRSEALLLKIHQLDALLSTMIWYAVTDKLAKAFRDMLIIQDRLFDIRDEIENTKSEIISGLVAECHRPVQRKHLRLYN